MSLRERLRHAEEQGAKAAHRGADLVRSGMHNVESNLRKLRPKKAASPELPVSSHADPEQESGSSGPKARTGIVSVNGQDVGKMRCTGGR